MISSTPKILPWLARKARVGEARAVELWEDAIRYATAKTGWVGTSEYWRVAVERLVQLLDAESNQPAKPALSPIVRLQTRMWLLPLIAWHGASVIAAKTWSRFASHRLRTL